MSDTDSPSLSSDGEAEDYSFITREPKNLALACSTDKLERSDLAQSIRVACGITSENKQSVLSLLKYRECGINFSSGTKSMITGQYLPNTYQRIKKFSSKPFCGIYSKNGQHLLTTVQDKDVYLFRVNSRIYSKTKRFSIPSYGWSIVDAAFSSDDRYFVYSGWSDNVYLHAVHGNTNERESLLIKDDRRMRFCIFSIKFSSDDRELLCGGNDECLYIYDRELKTKIRVKNHRFDVNSVAYADKSSQILFSAGDDGLCRVWDRRLLNVNHPKPVGIHTGHQGSITHIEPRGDGTYYITNSKDQTIKLWDTRVFSSSEAQKEARHIVINANIAWDYRWQNVPKSLLNPPRLIKGDTSVMTYRGHIVSQTLIRCRFSPTETTGQRFICTGDGCGRIIIYDVLSGKIIHWCAGHEALVRDVNWHPHHPEIVSTSWDGGVYVWRYQEEPVDNDRNKHCRDMSPK
ncbi:DDB1- and CUL4-associated factor 11 [Trichogramma pretiosum]|uniref:DDB1- and CUL4-associated factor 11 n=1 Tax=Trichogramma pretiosum TaxID=7493 RepID=UPI0006C94DEC|nr:DDB1- and CUL4-associated factor 11 [Trichogramma pretiosum]